MRLVRCSSALGACLPSLKLASLVFALCVLSACARSSFDGQVYRDSEVAFRVGQLPPSFHAVKAEGTRLAFRDDANDITVAVNGRCGLDGDDVPLPALTRHLFIHFTQREVISERRVELDGREALRTELSAELDGVPRRFVVYVLKKDGCVYDFMWIARPEATASVTEFERFVLGFSTRI
ncbi:MAG TPA: hypothetical protein VFQ61_23480 [Polyangiaceae bacterium]|nr:hypothetical protein [Polyangiaceae bacterium]